MIVDDTELARGRVGIFLRSPQQGRSWSVSAERAKHYITYAEKLDDPLQRSIEIHIAL